jgi:hypothetical protein
MLSAADAAQELQPLGVRVSRAVLAARPPAQFKNSARGPKTQR